MEPHKKALGPSGNNNYIKSTTMKMEKPESQQRSSVPSNMYTIPPITQISTGSKNKSNPTGSSRPRPSPNKEMGYPISGPGTPKTPQESGCTGYPPLSKSVPLTSTIHYKGDGPSPPLPPPYYSSANSRSSTPVAFTSPVQCCHHPHNNQMPPLPPQFHNHKEQPHPKRPTTLRIGPCSHPSTSHTPPTPCPSPSPQSHPHNHHDHPPPPTQKPLNINMKSPQPRLHIGKAEFRLYQLNKRLKERPQVQDNNDLWWHHFTEDYFTPDATLSLTFSLDEDSPMKTFTIGRQMIPRYFRTVFEGGATDLSFNATHPKEIPQPGSGTLTLDSHQCTMLAVYSNPTFTQVSTEGRLILNFIEEGLRIKSFYFAVITSHELVSKREVAMVSSQERNPKKVTMSMGQLTTPVTRQGFTNATLRLLRMCAILEPMQELMSREKETGLHPRECLKTTLYQKWQKTVPTASTAGLNRSQNQQPKRRKRRGPSWPPGNSSSGPVPPMRKISSSHFHHPNKNMSDRPSHDNLMYVGEPSYMDDQFGCEDERLITRVENNSRNGPPGDSKVIPFGGEFPVRCKQQNDWNRHQDQGQSNTPP